MNSKEVIKLIENSFRSFGKTPNGTKLNVINEFDLNALKEKLTLTEVSHRRELLIAFANYIDLNKKNLGGKKTFDLVDYFIAINCG